MDKYGENLPISQAAIWLELGNTALVQSDWGLKS